MDRSRRSGERGGGFFGGIVCGLTKSCVILGLPGYNLPTMNMMYGCMGISRWWQLKYFLIFTPKIGEDEPILTIIFFKGVETTNQIFTYHE